MPIAGHPVEVVTSARRHHHIQMSISIEISCTDEVWLRGNLKDFRRREEWRVGEFAMRFARFGFVGVGIDRIDVSAM